MLQGNKLMKNWPKISVVISNYNGLNLNILEESIASILKNNYPNLEVLMVDNASTDRSVSTIKKRFGQNPKLKILQNNVNMYSQGLNIGINNSTGEFIAFFNNDVVVENGYFQEFVKFFNQNPDVVLAQGKLLSYYDHHIIDSAGEVIDSYGSPITLGARTLASDGFKETTKVLSVSGSCSMIRKSTLDEVGLLDPDYGIGYEDLDLALRCWLKGYKVMYYPKVRAFHRRGVTDLSPELRVKVRWHFNKNRIATMIKNYPPGFILKNLPKTILIYSVAGLWEIIVKRKVKLGLTRFSSILWNLIHLPQTLAKRGLIQSQAKKGGKKMIEQLLYKKSILKEGFLLFVHSK